MLFELRGRGKNKVAAALRERRIQGMDAAARPAYVPEAVDAVEVASLDDCLEHYPITASH